MNNALDASARQASDPLVIEPNVALCVDLDGTLIHTDLLLESSLALLRKNPLYAFLCLGWLTRGRAYLKQQIAQRAELKVQSLPYNLPLLRYLSRECECGRALFLCTASNERYAQAVANHLALFDGVIASNAQLNCSAGRKASELVERFGERGFDYCGNARADLAVWARSRHALVVGSGGIVAAAKRIRPGARVFERRVPLLRLILKEMRVYQWVKNLLVFVPLLASHRFLDPAVAWTGVVAFLSFSLCASAVYLLNDMLDLESDREHPRKRQRPFASGGLSLWTGIWLFAALMTGSLALSLLLRPQFGLALGAYFLLTLAYSLSLKQKLLLDVFALATLFTVRIVAGATAADITITVWMALFSVTLFLSLAMVKRYAELDSSLRAGKSAPMARPYFTSDLEILRSLGTGSGYLAPLVLALYINSTEVDNGLAMV